MRLFRDKSKSGNQSYSNKIGFLTPATWKKIEIYMLEVQHHIFIGKNVQCKVSYSQLI